ncbi:hypothetical protein [Vallitalea okinawensis]|uniref:hypothetical protein n=1 Tax=Vallitalea okinawensis TaxID=2078660 RepID=UPI001300738A|nr:hypothetical protein [Vallitalea okinawensis]
MNCDYVLTKYESQLKDMNTQLDNGTFDKLKSTEQKRFRRQYNKLKLMIEYVKGV